ncbi:MAG: rRNA (cytidine1402-2-O)-methyltransferase [Patescibacteria group bacterium]|jgi:16S rRNA (cytidine1402-2'-O)-methyltransferase|nr:rRNA (cytidine1402-2-O)-methyltransferase [Patescibacteria group bacterium]
MANEIGTLYIVATPIGNMEDITMRALRILKEVDLILCEDTRTTGKLLARYEIKNKTSSYHAHSTKGKESAIIKLLNDGKNIALVSDAGTPCISDPGILLVQEVYNEFGSNARVVPIPGASALITALSACGVSMAVFKFLGFLPHKKGRETLFKEMSIATTPIVFYESSHRIIKTLESLSKYCGDKNVVIGRELTKIYEEFLRAKPSELLEILTKDKNKQKGEFVVIVYTK